MQILIFVLAGQFWPIHLSRKATFYATVSFAYDRNPFRYSDEAIERIVHGEAEVPVKSIDDFRTGFRGAWNYGISRTTTLEFVSHIVAYARNTGKSYQKFSVSLRNKRWSMEIGYTPYRLLFYTLTSNEALGYHEIHSRVDWDIPLKAFDMKFGVRVGEVKFENPKFDYLSGRFYQFNVGVERKNIAVEAGYRHHGGASGDIFRGYTQAALRFSGKFGIFPRLKLEFAASYRNRRMIPTTEGYNRIDDLYSLSAGVEYRVNRRFSVVPHLNFSARRIWRDFASPISIGRGMVYNRLVVGTKLRMRM